MLKYKLKKMEKQLIKKSVNYKIMIDSCNLFDKINKILYNYHSIPARLLVVDCFAIINTPKSGGCFIL